MRRRSPRGLALALAPTLAPTLALLVALPAAADPQQTVITTARPAPRADVRAACPDIAEVLERELGPAVQMLGHEGTVRVEFRLQDGRVWEAVSRGGPRAYRQPIRRALQALACPAGAAGERFAFAIRFDLQPAAEGPQRLAWSVLP